MLALPTMSQGCQENPKQDQLRVSSAQVSDSVCVCVCVCVFVCVCVCKLSTHTCSEATERSTSFSRIIHFWTRLNCFPSLEMKVSQSCLILCDCMDCPDPMDCSLPGSSVHGILQTRILEWVAIPFSKGPSQPRKQTWVSLTDSGFFTVQATREA